VRRLVFCAAVSIVSFSLFSYYCAAEVDSDTAPSAQSGPTANAVQPDANSATAAAPVLAVTTPPTVKASHVMPSRFGMAVKVSPLGLGIEAATPLSYHMNLRVGANAFSYSHGLNESGVNYNANLNLRSVESHLDWFPFAGAFHLSPGALFNYGNQVTGSASVGGGQAFTLGSTKYVSGATSPITGTGKIAFDRFAPSFLMGWGNLLPRSPKHFTVPFEFGAVFDGVPKATLSLTGSACSSTGSNCHNIGNDSSFQNNVIAQQNKLNNDMSFLKAYPVISLGFGYKF